MVLGLLLMKRVDTAVVRGKRVRRRARSGGNIGGSVRFDGRDAVRLFGGHGRRRRGLRKGAEVRFERGVIAPRRGVPMVSRHGSKKGCEISKVSTNSWTSLVVVLLHRFAVGVGDAEKTALHCAILLNQHLRPCCVSCHGWSPLALFRVHC